MNDQGFDAKKLILNKELGAGSYGTVYRARIGFKQQSDDIPCAVKVMNRDVQTDTIKNESNILKQLKHTFIVGFMIDFREDQKYYIVLEYLHGDLHKVLNLVGNLRELDASFYLKEVILGLEYLHSKNIIHKDLKPGNILLDKNGHVRITDFGLSIQLQNENEQSTDNRGTFKYMAPEVIMKTGYRTDADWWSLGVIFYVMVSGSCPFPRTTRSEYLRSAITGNFIMPSNISPEAADFLTQLLKYPKRRRLGFYGVTTIKSHCFFKDTNWENVAHCLEVPPVILEDGNLKTPAPNFLEGLSEKDDMENSRKR